ncbi:hypothetical protein V6N11_046729 [Hibiscus sabdariffa]|uniref:Uncharacterized protein n=1 Tax=Hibiscus sabdariffa TaxID=183260 RepID=A0ABR2NGD8_9ROSI
MPSGEAVISESLSIDDDSSSTSGFFNKQINPLHIVPNDNTIGAATSASSFADVIGSSSDSSQSASSQSASLVSSTPGIQESDLALHSHDLAMESDLQHNAAIESMSHGSAPTLPDQEAVLQGRSMSSVALKGVTLTEESNSQSEIHKEESAHTAVEDFICSLPRFLLLVSFYHVAQEFGVQAMPTFVLLKKWTGWLELESTILKKNVDMNK